MFGVGDDDQVLYDHVGATPRYLLDFEALFPGAADQPLTVNYRCPPAIVSYACNLLARNQERVPKQITAAPGRADPDDGVRLVEVPATQQAAAAGQVLALWLRDRRPQDIAVLARVNVALLPVQVELALAGIPHTSPVGPALLERTGVRSALAYLRLATAARGALDGADLAEVLYRPFRPLPGDLRDALRGRRWTVAGLARLGADRLEGRSLTSWQQLVSDLSQLREAAQQGQPSAELLRLVRDHVGVDRAAGDLDASGESSVGASHVDDLDALALIALRCPDPGRLPTFLLEMLALSVPSGTPAVRLSSVHRVKGLEWQCVLLVGAAERLCPHRLAIGPAALEAERRVWHVAITRARERLAVVVPVPGASRFLAEMLEVPPWRPSPGRPPVAPRSSVRRASQQTPGVARSSRPHARGSSRPLRGCACRRRAACAARSPPPPRPPPSCAPPAAPSSPSPTAPVSPPATPPAASSPPVPPPRTKLLATTTGRARTRSPVAPTRRPARADSLGPRPRPKYGSQSRP